MENYLKILEKCPLFASIELEHIAAMLNCLQAQICNFKRGNYIISAGDKAGHVGIVLSGKVQISRTDYYGNRKKGYHAAMAWYSRGCVLSLTDDDLGAINSYLTAKDLFPDTLSRYYMICEHNLGKQYLQTALDNGSKTLSSFDKGRIYYYMEDYENAHEEFEKAISDEKAESSLFLGKSYEATGDLNFACRVYRTYLDKHGDSSEMYNQLGVCELKRGNYDEALSAFKAGRGLDDKEMQQTLTFNEIVAYEFLGNFTKAEELMQDYLKMYPGDEEALREQIFLSTRQGGAKQDSADN